MAASPEICSFSHLPITSRPEWQQISFGPDYHTSIELIGERIIINHSVGAPDFDGIKKAMQFMNSLISREINKPFVNIFDYQGITRNVSLEARRYAIQELGKRKDMLAAIYFGLNPALKFSIKIAAFFKLLPFTCVVCDNYRVAINNAVKIIREQTPRPGTSSDYQFFNQETERIVSELEPVEDYQSLDLALEMLDDEINFLDEQEARQRHLQTLERLRRIIDERNTKARIYQRSRHSQDSDDREKTGK